MQVRASTVHTMLSGSLTGHISLSRFFKQDACFITRGFTRKNDRNSSQSQSIKYMHEKYTVLTAHGKQFMKTKWQLKKAKCSVPRIDNS